MASSHVSIHAPAGGATETGCLMAISSSFQSTRPRGARLPISMRCIFSTSFNPRARGGRDFRSRCVVFFLQVSIHAPAGGATLPLCCATKPNRFQSTRPRGARLFLDAGVISVTMFQSTRPRGARRARRTALVAGSVSIHAPAGGATNAVDRRRPGVGFNPRARGGRDRSTRIHSTMPTVSIHAPAGGATYLLRSVAQARRFNPRARGGRDDSCPSAAVGAVVSIHAPAGGATPFDSILGFASSFQSTRPRGARRCPPSSNSV